MATETMQHLLITSKHKVRRVTFWVSPQIDPIKLGRAQYDSKQIATMWNVLCKCFFIV